jgi:hypothetical protein
MTLLCPYCGAQATLHKDSSVVYHKNFGPIWACLPCGAWVGCHPGTMKPLGRLANKQLRDAKVAAHKAFDPLWQRKMKESGWRRRSARSMGYKWLAAQLGIPKEECHIGMFNLEQCQEVIKICKGYM